MHNRLKVIAVVAVLLCALAALEFPELANLTDDTSNDFACSIFGETDVAAPDVVIEIPTPPRTVALKDSKSWEPVGEFYSSITAYSADDLFPFLCIYRT